MDLERAFRQNWRQHGWATTGQPGLVAVSTGVDSMVLLALLLALPATERPDLTVVHVNHHLRAQSQTEAAFLKRWCEARHVPLVVRDWPVAQHPNTGVEAAARDFRYRFFEEQLRQRGAAWVATAHQADEQAETILLKLLRGGDLGQLRGMAASRPLGSGEVRHPLLPFTKAQLRAYARQHALPWYEDATNQDLVARRNRIRHQILPQLQAENPQVVAHLQAYAAQLTATLAVADRTLDRELTAIVSHEQPLTGRVAPLLAYPLAEQRLLLARLIKRVAPERSTAQATLDQCLTLLTNPQRPTGQVVFGRGWVFEKRYRTFLVWQPEKFGENPPARFNFMVVLNQWQPVGNGRLLGVFEAQTSPTLPAAQTVTLSVAQLPLTVRPWRPTDRLRLADGHHQTVRRALINAKVPQSSRSQVPVLVTAQGTVLAALGVKWAVWPHRENATTYHIGYQPESVKGEQHE
ncbi:tRNA lysidine(34) synthetase TilS [Levilactobacillus spicheri]|uniref:tRNA(Ile)-lysidine synthase n=1 Tax=Levilactobacillus spicheri TaxID=216463 RepID=A0A0F3RTJ6_9LACO|nr:tRNA lysidine(34) synthetase TilS [Levilactobacillus spicheri]KJW12924.1 tRNA(Ile)-lysidine synthetase [Levilactobacillus spicheri]